MEAEPATTTDKLGFPGRAWQVRSRFVGTGFPGDLTAEIRLDCPLRRKLPEARAGLMRLAAPEGLEPPTPSLGRRRSIR